jgi:putative transposase
MVSFIDKHRAQYGVEPICTQLPIAPSVYYEQKAREAKAERIPPRVRRDTAMSGQIQRVYQENFKVYGARKVWRQLGREDIHIARCTVERLMRVLGLQGVRRGKWCRTTIADTDANRPADLVKRQFKATRPNQLWVDRFYLCGDMDWLCLRGLRHRCVRSPRYRLESGAIYANRSCPGRFGAGDLVAFRNRWSRPS